MVMASNFTATFSFVCLSRPCQTCTTCCVCLDENTCFALLQTVKVSHPKPLQSSLNTQNWQSGVLLLTGMEQYNGNRVLLCQIFTFASCKLRSEPAPNFFSIWYRPFATVEGGFEPEHGTARHGTTRHDIGEVRSFLSSPVSSLQVHHFQSFVVCTKPQNSLEVNDQQSIQQSIFMDGISVYHVFFHGISYIIYVYHIRQICHWVILQRLWGFRGQGVCGLWSLTPLQGEKWQDAASARWSLKTKWFMITHQGIKACEIFKMVHECSWCRITCLEVPESSCSEINGPVIIPIVFFTVVLCHSSATCPNFRVWNKWRKDFDWNPTAA